MTTYTGTSGNDVLTGGSKKDVLYGRAGNDTLNGGANNDILDGGAGDDTLNGGTGDDTLKGGAGADAMNGGDGYDTATYASASSKVTIDLKTGNNKGDALGDTFSSIERIIGTKYDDIFVSGLEAIDFDGRDGHDTVDYSTSSAGITVDLDAGTGSGGDAEGDTYVSIETVIGSDFNDVLSSSSTGHFLIGGAGDDIYYINSTSGQPAIVENAGEGNDEIRTQYGYYQLQNNIEKVTYIGPGGAGWLRGNSGDNVITGGSGNDILDGGNGADELIGGAGYDTAKYTTRVTIDLKTGMGTGYALGDTFSSIEHILGSDYDDTFISGSEAIDLDGGAGHDTVDYSTSSAGITVDLNAGTGSGGDAEGDTYVSIETVIGSDFNDVLSSSSTGDFLIGGAGDDIYYINSTYGQPAIVENAGEGNDEVRTQYGYYNLANNVEKVTYIGPGGAGWLRGNSGDNVITGGSGNDTLDGGNGADELIGGAGNDILIGGVGDDTFVFNAGFGNDVITDFEAGAGVGDIIQFATDVFANFTEVMDAATQIGGDTVIELDSSNTITLKDVMLTSLHQDDFSFAIAS